MDSMSLPPSGELEADLLWNTRRFHLQVDPTVLNQDVPEFRQEVDVGDALDCSRDRPPGGGQERLGDDIVCLASSRSDCAVIMTVSRGANMQY